MERYKPYKFNEKEKNLESLMNRIFGYAGSDDRSVKVAWEEFVDIVIDIALLLKVDEDKITHKFSSDSEGDILEIFYKKKSLMGLIDIEKGRIKIFPSDLRSIYEEIKHLK